MQPTEFTAADCLGTLNLFNYSMAFNWDCEIMRHKILTGDGAEALRALDHSYPEYKLSVPPNNAVSGDPVDYLAEDLSRLLTFSGKNGGCNNWAIAPSRTATGRPILANDLHIGPAIPSPWYLCKITTPEISVAGVSFPGAPAIPVGHNGTCAWGMTAGMSDVVDLFKEEIGADGKSIRQGDDFVPCEVVKEIIRVKGAGPVEEEVLITPRGPIISPALKDVPDAFSMCAVWLKKLPIDGLFSIHKADSFEYVNRIFEDWPTLPIHMVYADDAGNIGWQLAGRVPVRKKGHGMLPQEGWDPEAGWEDELVPAGEMPMSYNPEAGFIVTANNKPFDDFDNKPFIAVDWVDGFRAARITEMLAQGHDWDNDSVMKLQQDLSVIPWREIRDTVLSLPQETEQMKQAFTFLSRWDGRASADSAAAAIYELFMNEMMHRANYAKAPNSAQWMLGEGVDPTIPHTFVPMRRASLLIRLIREQPEGWFKESWEEEMVIALSVAIDKLRRKYGNDPSCWSWGHIRPMTLTHQLAAKKPLNKVFNVGPLVWGGDTHTVAQSYVDQLEPLSNPSVVVTLRYVVDVGNWDDNLFALAGGQSGNPFSPHYSDMLKLIQQGTGTSIPWSKEKEDKIIKSVLELVPNAG